MEEMKKLLSTVQVSYEVQLNENNAIKEVIKNLEQKYHKVNDEKERYLDEIIKIKSEQGESMNNMNEMQKEVQLARETISAEKKRLEEAKLEFERMKEENALSFTPKSGSEEGDEMELRNTRPQSL